MEHKFAYLVRKSTRKSRILFVGSIVVVISILFATHFFFKGSKNKIEQMYIGKVVKVIGAINEIGVVLDFKENEFIVIKPIGKPSSFCSLHKLSGQYSIQLLAENEANYVKSERTDSDAPQLERDSRVLMNQAEPVRLMANDAAIHDVINPEPPLAEPTSADTPMANAGRPDADADLNKKSEWDLQREQDVAAFELEVKELAKKADEMDIQYTRYHDACFKKYTYGATSVWLDFLGGMAIDNETTPECRKIWSDFVRLSEEIKSGMEEAMERARKAGVYPGHQRDIREKYKMDWSGWD